jgi:N-acetylglucosaminyl-diphospho-decaprenol L-rhamnosyltransferase
LRGNAKLQSVYLSIIIVNYNNPDLIDACLLSIDKYLSGIHKEIIVVDNYSKTQNLAEHKKKYSDLRVIYLPSNMGFGYANNVGAKNANGDVLLLLNSDAEFTDDSFRTMLASFSARPTGELWGPRLIWPDGKFQQSYSREINYLSFLTNYTSLQSLFKIFNLTNWHKYNSEEFVTPTEVNVIYGTAMLMNKSDYEQMGGFSKKYFMYFEDIDLCDRFKKNVGGLIKFQPSTTLIHRVKGSSTNTTTSFKFTKSKYIYGISKFGYLAMTVIFPLDIVFEAIKNLARLAFRRC